MKKIKPRFAYGDDGKKDGVTVTIKEFEQLIDGLDDLDDYHRLKDYDTEQASKGAISLEDLKIELGIH